jgi:hypothetical protein
MYCHGKCILGTEAIELRIVEIINVKSFVYTYFREIRSSNPTKLCITI